MPVRARKFLGNTAINSFLPPAFIREFAPVTSTTTVTSLGLTVPTGGAQVGDRVEIVALGALTISGITDAGGNTYAGRVTQANGNLGLTIWSARVTTGLSAGGTVTVSFSAGVANIVLAAAVFRNTAAVSPVDAIASTAGASTSPSTGSVATTADYDLIVAAFAMGSGSPGTQTPGAGWVALTGTNVASSRYLAWQYRVLAAAGSTTPGMTTSVSRSWTGAAVAYKAG
jgi:hypothetical protein